jgi:hypothetical protein
MMSAKLVSCLRRPAGRSCRKRTVLAAPHVVKGQRADSHADQSTYSLSDRGEHPPHLALPALPQHHAQPVAIRTMREEVDRAPLRAPLLEVDAPLQLPALGVAQRPGNEYMIFLRDLEPWVGNAVGEVAVVGQQQQPLAVSVEPSNGIDARPRRHKIPHRPTPPLVANGAHVAGRLVQQVIVVRGPRRRNGLSVHSETVVLTVHQHAWLSHDGTVDRDAALAHQRLRGAARAYAGGRENLLDALRHDPPSTAGARRQGKLA